MNYVQLSDEQFAAWRDFQSMRVQLMSHLARRLGEHSGLSDAEFTVLVGVSRSSTVWTRARELCHFLSWETSRLSHQITRMEKRELVERRESPEDARGFEVRLTKLGRQTIRKASRLQGAEVQHCFSDVLSAEQIKALQDISQTLLAHQDTHHSPQ
jgi:DNA-binding MarR family transcriptional regulator